MRGLRELLLFLGVLGCVHGVGMVHGQSTFAGFALIDGELNISEEYFDEDEGGLGLPAPVSLIDGATLAGSALGYLGTGGAQAEQGVMHAWVEGYQPSPALTSGVLTVLGYTDTVTLFADGLDGEAGTLHLEYAMDGTIDVKAGSFGSISLSLINGDLPVVENLDDPAALNGAETFDAFSAAYYDFADTLVVHTPEDPLLVSLDIPVTFGTPVTYGASLMLMLFGEGMLDFSQTLEFSGASVSDSGGQVLGAAAVSSSAGIGYGSLNAVPEPGVSLLLAGSVLCAAGRRARSR